jgi:hypothetical protein
MGCVHRWQIDNHNIGTCSLCGEVRQFPLEGREVVILKKGNHSSSDMQKEEIVNVHIAAKNKYYEDNKQAIIADLLARGKAYTRRRWRIPKGSLGRLMSRWLTKEQMLAMPISEPEAPATTPGETPHPSTSSTPSDGRLPPFPPFSAQWPPEVQLEWLSVYEALATRKG